MFVLTESGRIIDDSSRVPLELVGGSWVPARSPLLCGEILKGRLLSEEEVRAYIEKSGKTN